MPHFPHKVSSKLPHVGTSIFSVMSALAQAHGAINMSQGFPDFPVPEQLVKLVSKHMAKGHNQYAPMRGVPVLREAIASKIQADYGGKYDPATEIVVTAGASQAIFTVMMSLIKEGDEVIIFTPAYDSYVPAIELAGGKAVAVQLSAPDYRIDWEEFKSRFNRKTRMVILNTPHNPTGTTLAKEDVEILDKLMKDTEALVLSDEVYEHIVFDGNRHESLARYPGLANRTLIVASFGKTYHATGWKLGYVAGPENVIAEFCKVHQYDVFTCNTPMQYAIADFINESNHHHELSAFYQEKRDRFVNGLKDTPLAMSPSSGTYFQLLSFADLADGLDTEVANEWTVSKGIASIPISVFYLQPVQESVLRFCFAKTDKTLDAAIEKLQAIC